MARRRASTVSRQTWAAAFKERLARSISGLPTYVAVWLAVLAVVYVFEWFVWSQSQAIGGYAPAKWHVISGFLLKYIVLLPVPVVAGVRFFWQPNDRWFDRMFETFLLAGMLLYCVFLALAFFGLSTLCAAGLWALMHYGLLLPTGMSIWIGVGATALIVAVGLLDPDGLIGAMCVSPIVGLVAAVVLGLFAEIRGWHGPVGANPGYYYAAVGMTVGLLVGFAGGWWRSTDVNYSLAEAEERERAIRADARHRAWYWWNPAHQAQYARIRAIRWLGQVARGGQPDRWRE